MISKLWDNPPAQTTHKTPTLQLSLLSLLAVFTHPPYPLSQIYAIHCTPLASADMTGEKCGGLDQTEGANLSADKATSR